MSSYANLTTQRVKKMLLKDKLASPAQFKQTLKLELFGLLSQFLELDAADIKLSITVEPDGKYKVAMLAMAENVKPAVGTF